MVGYFSMFVDIFVIFDYFQIRLLGKKMIKVMNHSSLERFSSGK